MENSDDSFLLFHVLIEYFAKLMTITAAYLLLLFLVTHRFEQVISASDFE